jgi:hypothetical protein
MTVPGLVCGPCGTELPPNAKSYNESAVPEVPGPVDRPVAATYVSLGSTRPTDAGCWRTAGPVRSKTAKADPAMRRRVSWATHRPWLR